MLMLGYGIKNYSCLLFGLVSKRGANKNEFGDFKNVKV